MKPTKRGNNFVISIKHQQYETWQGTIQWIEGQKTENFRSALELIKLIDSTMQKEDNCEQEG